MHRRELHHSLCSAMLIYPASLTVRAFVVSKKGTGKMTTSYYFTMCVYKDVWNHRTGNPMPLQALSAGTSLTLCGVAPVAAHCSVLEPLKTATRNKCDNTKQNINNQRYKHKDY